MEERREFPIEPRARFEMLRAVLVEACESASRQYDDYYRSFAGLDGKAQSTATASGIVLASVVASFNAGRMSSMLTSLGTFGYFIVLAPPISALISVILSLLAARATEVEIPFNAIDRMTEAENLAGLPLAEFTDLHVTNYYRERMKQWESSINDIAKKVEKKGKWVIRGQVMMTVAFALLIPLLIFLIAYR
jgi:hypothetical protein